MRELRIDSGINTVVDGFSSLDLYTSYDQYLKSMANPIDILFTSHSHLLVPECMDAFIFEDEADELQEHPLFI